MPRTKPLRGGGVNATLDIISFSRKLNFISRCHWVVQCFPTREGAQCGRLHTLAQCRKEAQ